MNWKNLKLGAKLGVGFGILIAIALILGLLAVFNMRNVTTESNYLAKEYVPEAKMAMELRGAANRVMYEMRGYALSMDETFYRNAQNELRDLDNAIKDLEKLDNKAERLVKLEKQLEIANEATNNYKQLVDQTVELTSKIEINRQNMDKAAANFISSCKSSYIRSYIIC